jgi:hypothetical protein
MDQHLRNKGVKWRRKITFEQRSQGPGSSDSSKVVTSWSTSSGVFAIALSGGGAASVKGVTSAAMVGSGVDSGGGSFGVDCWSEATAIMGLYGFICS